LSSRKLIRTAAVLYLVFPFLFLAFHFTLLDARAFSSGAIGEFFWAFKNSFLQAFFSALFSVALGVWVSFGLISFSKGFRRHYRSALEVLCLLPNFLPPLFTLLSLLNLIDPFPMGLTGITVVHTMMNFGLVAVMLAHTVEKKIGSLAELAYVEGASKSLFFRKAFWPLLKRDLFLLFLFVFVVCFGSFAVPLIVGGGRGTTIEVLIYEKIRLSNNWSQAVLLALLQSAFIFLVSLLAIGERGIQTERTFNLAVLRRPSGIFILVVLMSMAFLGYIQGIIDGIHQLSAFYELQSPLIWNFLGTLLLGLSVGALSLASLFAVAYCWPKPWFAKFLRGYMAPSTALCCFAFLMFGSNESYWPFIKIPLAFNLLCIGSFYRMGWEGVLNSLETQVAVAGTLGAKPSQIFRKVLLPQISSRAALIAGVAAVWACGDFAVSRILADRDISLAMMTETLMSSYRLGLASVLSLSLIVCGAICFFMMIGVGHVLSRKPL
jgi:thiamine transport system permease protein